MSAPTPLPTEAVDVAQTILNTTHIFTSPCCSNYFSRSTSHCIQYFRKAVKSGAALKAIPALVQFVINNGIDGVLADYEPQDTVTEEHAQLYANWLKAAAGQYV